MSAIAAHVASTESDSDTFLNKNPATFNVHLSEFTFNMLVHAGDKQTKLWASIAI